MNNEIAAKLNHLRNNYEEIKGHPFNHFFCPVLFNDEETELCKAHIVNQAFSDSSRAWTIQRKDVDGFYGRHFEDDFTSLEYKIRNLSPVDAIADNKLSKKLKPKILMDGQQVDYFVTKSDHPTDFVRMEIENNSEHVDLTLKLHPNELEPALNRNWEFEINNNIKLPALVSLIKSAHLTLFELLGYHYASSLGGYFVGRQILGEFYLQSQRKSSTTEIKKSAYPFFREFVNMVRPIESFKIDIKGTITDQTLFVCQSNHVYWTFIVFIKTSKKLHAVTIPIFDKTDSVATFIDFLKKDRETHITGSFCKFDRSKKQWSIDKKSHEFIWPQSGFSID